jgi:hypothetical protein
MHKFTITLGATFIALSTFALAPATASVLKFDFTTQNGGAGTFNLDTNAAPYPETVIFRPGITGITFPNAVSNFSFSAPYVQLNNDTANWSFAPSITADFFGLPSNLGILGGVNYPSGCTTPTSFTCTFNVAGLYSGNLSKLSDNPLDYRGIGTEVYDPTTVEIVLRDDFTNFRVQSVPEPDSILGILAFGIGCIIQLKHNSPRK